MPHPEMSNQSEDAVRALAKTTIRTAIQTAHKESDVDVLRGIALFLLDRTDGNAVLMLALDEAKRQLSRIQRDNSEK